MLRDARPSMVSSGMVKIRLLSGFVIAGRNRMQDAPLPLLLLKISGCLAVTLAMLRLLSLG